MRDHVRRGRLMVLPPPHHPDYLLSQGERVMHILGPAHVDEASLTAGAEVCRDDNLGLDHATGRATWTCPDLVERLSLFDGHCGLE
jgi:hypothetical protein